MNKKPIKKPAQHDVSRLFYLYNFAIRLYLDDQNINLKQGITQQRFQLLLATLLGHQSNVDSALLYQR